jgi:hypothetical protein
MPAAKKISVGQFAERQGKNVACKNCGYTWFGSSRLDVENAKNRSAMCAGERWRSCPSGQSKTKGKFQAVPCAQQKAGVQQDAAAAAMGDRADPKAALCLRYLQALFEIDSTRVGKPASATARSVCLTSPSLRPCTAVIPSEHLFNCTDARHLAVLMSKDTRCMPGMHFCFFA